MNSSNRLIRVEYLDDMINYQIYRMARLMRFKFQHDMNIAGLDMNQEQYFILFRLWEKDGQYQAELADELFGDTPNITRILDAMERKGFIVRRPDPDDRRKFRIHLAEGGRRIQKLYKLQAPESRLRDYRHLDDRDLEELKRQFKIIEDNITAQIRSERSERADKEKK
jgi:DNA-binding MarR family transcriptional regulator